MATIIKIVVSLVLLTALAQAGMAALTSYQFEDAIHQALLYAPNATDEEITRNVVSIAGKHGIELDAEAVAVRQVGPDLYVDVSYDADVPLLPGVYSRVWTFTPAASIRLMPGARNLNR